MYSILLTNGKIININADVAEWHEKDRMIKLINENRMVARINMDNAVGWIDADYEAESLEQEPILDKIRAEIEYKQEIQLKGEDISEWNKCIKEVLEIIDKYRAESEG